MSLFHRHRWTPVDVQHARHTLFGQGEVTLILLRCRCGKADTETVAGHWPAERFLSAEPEESDVRP
jgi:hypothetical protein